MYQLFILRNTNVSSTASGNWDSIICDDEQNKRLNNACWLGMAGPVSEQASSGSTMVAFMHCINNLTQYAAIRLVQVKLAEF